MKRTACALAVAAAVSIAAYGTSNAAPIAPLTGVQTQSNNTTRYIGIITAGTRIAIGTAAIGDGAPIARTGAGVPTGAGVGVRVPTGVGDGAGAVGAGGGDDAS